MPRRRFRRSRGCGALRVGSAWRLERIIFDVCGAPNTARSRGAVVTAIVWLMNHTSSTQGRQRSCRARLCESIEQQSPHEATFEQIDAAAARLSRRQV